MQIRMLASPVLLAPGQRRRLVERKEDEEDEEERRMRRRAGEEERRKGGEEEGEERGEVKTCIRIRQPHSHAPKPINLFIIY